SAKPLIAPPASWISTSAWPCRGSCAFTSFVLVAWCTGQVAPFASLASPARSPSTSVRPSSIERKPSMWSNDRFSIIRTTMWSTLSRRLCSAASSATFVTPATPPTLPGRLCREHGVQRRARHVDRPAAEEAAALADHDEHRRLVDRVLVPDRAGGVDRGG